MYQLSIYTVPPEHTSWGCPSACYHKVVSGPLGPRCMSSLRAVMMVWLWHHSNCFQMAQQFFFLFFWEMRSFLCPQISLFSSVPLSAPWMSTEYNWASIWLAGLAKSFMRFGSCIIWEKGQKWWSWLILPLVPGRKDHLFWYYYTDCMLSHKLVKS